MIASMSWLLTIDPHKALWHGGWLLWWGTIVADTMVYLLTCSSAFCEQGKLMSDASHSIPALLGEQHPSS